jgi:hypothetical protein
VDPNASSKRAATGRQNLQPFDGIIALPPLAARVGRGRRITDIDPEARSIAASQIRAAGIYTHCAMSLGAQLPIQPVTSACHPNAIRDVCLWPNACPKEDRPHILR